MTNSTRQRVHELEPHEVERWAHTTTTGSVGRKAVLQYLAARTDERGSCFPGQKSVATATEQGERTVRRHIADMAEAGLLCHQPRKRQDGRGRTSDRYFLHVDEQCARNDCPLLVEAPDQPANLAVKSTTNRPTEHDQPATGGRGGNYQSLNSQRKDTPEVPSSFSEGFEKFWETYPNKKERQNALKAWKARRREGIPAGKLIQAGANYTRKCKIQRTEVRFIKHGATFLGPSEVWKDYLDDGAAMADVQYLRAVGDTIYDETPVVYS